MPPDLAPYIEFTGELRQNLATGDTPTERFGRVTYRIYLGYTAENDPANDYDIERNVHYTYNVTIKGMNDLVVEAKYGQGERGGTRSRSRGTGV